MGQNFQICLRSGPTGLPPPLTVSLTVKYMFFYESPKHSPKLPFPPECPKIACIISPYLNLSQCAIKHATVLILLLFCI